MISMLPGVDLRGGVGMRKNPSPRRRLNIFFLGLVLAFASTASAGTPVPIRIMPLGDSITYGSLSTDNVGYRRPKWGRTKPTIQCDKRYHRIHRLNHGDNEVFEQHNAVIG